MNPTEETRMTTTPALPLLDELRAKATADMPWRQDSGWGENILGASGEAIGGVEFPSDAALIVAAVNRLPQLTAALRAVLARLDFADGTSRAVHGTADGGAVWARDIRAAITTALEAS